jgi:hypothetical protein
MKLTGLRLVEVRSALTALKERRLPNLDTDLLVAALYTGLKSAFKEYDHVVKNLQRELEGTEDEAERKALTQRFEDLQDREFEVPEPRQKLGKENLPKTFAGERGENNSAANAGIIIALGEEYFDLGESD